MLHFLVVAYVSAVYLILIIQLCGLFSLETASLVTVGWVAGESKLNLQYSPYCKEQEKD